MALEIAIYIDDLVPGNPESGDNVSQGDDHIRLIKQVLQNQFPNLDDAMNASDEELNYSVGLTELLTTSLEKAAPVGSIVMWPTGIAPTQWLLCNGASISRTTYADLFAVIGTTYGNFDVNTFYLPDFRGEFVRGTDNGAGNDPDAASRTDRGDLTTGDNVGTKQSHQLDSHNHSYTVVSGTAGSGPGAANNPFTSTASANTSSTGGNETRPRNIGMNFIIKY